MKGSVNLHVTAELYVPGKTKGSIKLHYSLVICLKENETFSQFTCHD